MTNVPNNSILLPGRNDKGKRVVVRSVSGCFDGDEGVVEYGPFTYPYTVISKEIRKPGMPPFLRESKKTSVPYFKVYVEKWKRSFLFMETEIHPWVNVAEVL